MYCSKCGVKLSENSKFCQVCGTSADPASPAIPVTPEAPEGSSSSAPSVIKSGKKPLLIVLLVIAALIILGGGAFLVKTFLMKSFTETNIISPQYLLVVKGKEEVQIYAGNEKPVIIEGLCDQYSYSMDGRHVALAMDADDSGFTELWYCDKNKTDNIDENVYTFMFSADGNKIMYLKNWDNFSYKGDLYVYDVQSEKSSLVVKDAYMEYSISPDGKSMAYTSDASTDSEGNVDGFTGYVMINGGEAIALDENQFAFALTNNGKYMYYIQTDYEDSSKGILYINNGKKDEKIGSIDLNNIIFLNKDCSEIMFVKGGATYISVDGQSKKRVSDLSLNSIIRQKNTEYYSIGSYSVNAAVLGVNSLMNQIVAVGDTNEGGTTLTYMKADGKTVDIDTLDEYYYYYDISLMQNGKSLYYLNDAGKILKYKDYSDATEDPEKISGDEDIVTFTIMPDQSAIYYVDTDNTLWAQRGKNDPEEIASDVDTYSVQVSNDGKGIYYISDFEENKDGDGYAGKGTLSYISCTVGANPVEIADDAYYVEVWKYGTVYSVYKNTDEDTGSYIGSMFISENDKDFDEIMDDAIIG